jgi:hypothetical protein
MKLNRENYEEYFILYMDNELSDEERHKVEIFVQENADLKAELDMLLQSKLVPDTDINFDNKEILMTKNSSSISVTNYEEWLLSYIDNELKAKERNDVERFVTTNPAIQKELKLLQQTKLQTEEIVFQNKESLYRREEKARIVIIRWWRIAAAAVLILGISSTAIILLNKKPNNKPGDVVDVQPKEEKLANPTKPSIMEIPASELKKIASNDKIKSPIKENNDQFSVKRKNSVRKEKNKQPLQVKQEEPLIVDYNKKDNGLPEPTKANPYVKDENESADAAAIADHNESLTNQKENTGNTSVTSRSSDTYIIQEKTSVNPDVKYASTNNGNGQKGGLRGFFRKVTRTFEKRTNIKATDDDDRLLIAGLAIKLN